MTQERHRKDIENLSDDDLFDVVVSDDLPRHEPQYHRAALRERDRRRREREERHRAALEKLGEQLLQVVSGVVEKPNKPIMYALLFAVAVGTLINVLTHYFITLIDILLKNLGGLLT